MARPVSEYARKRNFDITSEPPESDVSASDEKGRALTFVVHKHDARNLHYDFRLELDGTLKSWAVPKGPSLDPKNKRLAVHVEDHPLDYGSFEGHIPEGQYGGGDVIVWDRGVWQPHGDPRETYKAGKLKFTLIGEKLTGDWALVRTHLPGSGDKEQWLLIKEKDSAVRSADDYDIVVDKPLSVVSGATVGDKRATAKTNKRKTAAAAPAAAEKKASGNTASPRSSSAGSSPVPEKFSPQLATLMDTPPEGEWLYEIKYDGYRILARIIGGEVRMITRNGHDWTDRLPLQAKAISELNLGDGWLDGEAVVLNDDGLPDFQALQNAFDRGRSNDIVYYLFDVPFINGEDIRERPVEERRAALKKLLGKQKKGPLRFSEAFSASHRDIIESACSLSLEGVIGKRAGSAYQSRRSPDWIKLKCTLRQEFVIVGFTQPQGTRSGFGALLLAVNEEGAGLVYAGRVGTGFNQKMLGEMAERLKAMEQDTSPLAKKLTSAQAKGVHWVKPSWVGEVQFSEWTREGIIRHASFIALRNDKPASEVVHEYPRTPKDIKAPFKPRAGKSASGKTKASTEQAKPAGKRSGKDKIEVAGVPISHPDRVIDSQSGLHKIDLAHYYESVADWILPHLDHRPVALLRCPEGVEGEQFFQKHADRLAIPHIKQLDPSLDPGHARLMEIDSVQALVGAAQMGTVELHTWGATYDKIELPDHFVLDLDPDPALPWRSMIEATQLTLSVLDEIGLDAYIKTSGGKGMHIVVPLARKADWETVKAFAKALAQFISQQLPERFTATSGPKNRVGKIFIDYLRNSRGASTVAAYSARARPGLPVSVPVTREELTGLKSSAQWNIGNVLKRLRKLKADPWAGYKNTQRITKPMWKRLGVKAPG
ncbi:DNA ligase D [Pseudomonas sp. GD03842]|uniref:DNA ligase D n=1 Tax=unclassified Pseudomonas TaxID=196821 RepID=UPI000D3392D5|nr:MULTISPECIES: DNA ligase D [unclassified Pseudomonas]MDH0745325.1 DNA ligase D [Pseudomonas sp. GD03842]RAU43398.1 DNA ligase D [Pseudomonas sp. RIT 409]RAU44962.1 DNA ligase D [Pseudomonas sp. RIT 412]